MKDCGTHTKNSQGARQLYDQLKMVRLAVTTAETPPQPLPITNNNHHSISPVVLTSAQVSQQSATQPSIVTIVTTNGPILTTTSDQISGLSTNNATNSQPATPPLLHAHMQSQQQQQPPQPHENGHGSNGPVFVTQTFPNEFYPPEYYIQHELCATHAPVCTLHSEYGKQKRIISLIHSTILTSEKDFF